MTDQPSFKNLLTFSTNQAAGVLVVKRKAMGSALLAMLLCAHVSAENLAEVYQLALENDPELAAAEATYKADSTIKNKALAELLPKLSGSYQWADNSGSSFNVSPTLSSGGRFESESYSASLTQNLINLQAIFGYRQALSTAEQAALTLGAAQQNLIVRTAEAYFDVLRGEDNLLSIKAEERAVERQLEQTQQRYEVGLIAITDVHEAQAAFDLVIANRIAQEAELGIAKESLAQITGQYFNSLASLEDGFAATPPEPADIDAWVNYADGNNIELQLARQALFAAQQNSNVKKSAFAPTVSGFADYSRSRNSPFQGNSTENDQFGIRVNWDVFNGGARWAEKKEAGYKVVAAQEQETAKNREVTRNTRSAYLQTNTGAARVKARQRAIVSSTSALDATQAGYDAGTRNIVDLLNAQRDLYSAQRDYANERYDYIISSLKLKQAAGIITAEDISSIPLVSAENSLEEQTP